MHKGRQWAATDILCPAAVTLGLLSCQGWRQAHFVSLAPPTTAMQAVQRHQPLHGRHCGLRVWRGAWHAAALHGSPGCMQLYLKPNSNCL